MNTSAAQSVLWLPPKAPQHPSLRGLFFKESCSQAFLLNSCHSSFQHLHEALEGQNMVRKQTNGRTSRMGWLMVIRVCNWANYTPECIGQKVNAIAFILALALRLAHSELGVNATPRCFPTCPGDTAHLRRAAPTLQPLLLTLVTWGSTPFPCLCSLLNY